MIPPICRTLVYMNALIVALFSPDYFCPADELYKNYITLSSVKEDPHAETIITRIHQFCDVSDPNICDRLQ